MRLPAELRKSCYNFLMIRMNWDPNYFGQPTHYFRFTITRWLYSVFTSYSWIRFDLYQLKEAMKIMGLSSRIHYLSWFIRTMTMLTISMVLIDALLTVWNCSFHLIICRKKINLLWISTVFFNIPIISAYWYFSSVTPSVWQHFVF